MVLFEAGRHGSTSFVGRAIEAPGETDFEEDLLRSAGPRVQKVFNNQPRTVADIHKSAWRRAEIPPGTHTTPGPWPACGALAFGGQVDGVRMLSLESIERARGEQANDPDAGLFGWPTRFGLRFALPPQVEFGGT
jgi:hypothetical protein